MSNTDENGIQTTELWVSKYVTLNDSTVQQYYDILVKPLTMSLISLYVYKCNEWLNRVNSRA